MKKLLLKTGLLTVGSISLLADDVKIYATSYEYPHVFEEQFKSEEQKLVEKYSHIFEIDEKVTYDKVREITNDFTNYRVGVKTLNENCSGYDYRVKYMINDVMYDDEELAILETVRDIYRNPEDYNLTENDLATDYEYEPTMCAEELIEHYSKLIGPNKYIAASIMYAECGSDLSSYNFLYNNNPAGLGPFNYYNNLEHGIISYMYVLKGYGCTEDTNESIFDIIGPTYCTEGTDIWLENTASFYYNIIDDYYYYAKMYGRKEEEKEKIHH